jgi:PKD repeat protein
MLKFVRNVVICLLAVFAPAGAFAQLHPMPGSKNEAPVLCTGCLGNNYHGQANDGLKTYPYSSPIKDHVGRYTDSTSTASFQGTLGFRTARARFIRTVPEQRGSAPPRVYIVIGSAIAAYPIDKFFTQMLPGGMVPINKIMDGIGGFGRTPPEDVLKWGGMVYPDDKDTVWVVPGQDAQDNIGAGAPMDFDDRGYIYSAYTFTGWGISRDDGRSDANSFPTLVQLLAGVDQGITKNDRSEVQPESMVAMKVGSKYYAVSATQSGKEAVWDVTDPAAPKLVRYSNSPPPADKDKNLGPTRDKLEYGIRRFDRNDDAQHVAIINGQNRLRVYEYSAFVSSANPVPIYEKLASFVDLSYDESGNLWAAEKNSRIWKFTFDGNSYSAVSYDIGRFDNLAIHVAAGHVFVQGTGYTSGSAFDARLWKIESGGLREVSLDGFFRKYYHSSPVDYAQPNSYNSPLVWGDVQIVKSGGKTYLMYSTIGLGDVFEIQGSDTIDIEVTQNDFGTKNPNSKGTAGPYPGDIVSFKAPSSNPNVTYDVTWDFGNPESTDNNTLKKSNVTLTHQYTGLNTTSMITSQKRVHATTVQDSQIQSEYMLTLKVPAPRVGVNGVTTPIAASTTGVEVIAGQTFNDASDGSIEGHYGSWTIDTTNTKLAPNETIAVGDVGTHTLQFQGVYGKYDASFTSTSPYQTPTLTVGYTVKPFKATIDAPATSGTNVKFTGSPLVAASPTVTATTWTVTWTFNPGGTSTSALTTQTTTGPINTIPEFLVPKADAVTGSTVTLKVEVDLLGLSTPAQAYPSFTDSITLSAPDPVVTKSGCANVGSPCTFTVSSPTDASMTGWTILWTSTGPSGTKTSTANPFSPGFSAEGVHTITLKATKSVFDKTVSQTVDVGPSLCQPLPASYNVSITKTGCSGTCPVGTTITFAPSFIGYSAQECDSFSWDLGSGQGTKPGKVVSHTYNTAGSYTVKLTISNPNGNLTETTNVTIGSSSGGDTCTAPTAAAITYTGCSTGGCKTTDNITFNAKRGTASLQTCDSVAWTFESNGVSGTRSPVKKWTTAGTYTVTAVISNSKGTSPTASIEVTVTAAASGNCSTAPSAGNFAITFSGPASGCTNTNGQTCQPAEAINFDADDYYYAPGSCDHYEWDFGDSTTKVNTRQATHSFTNSGSYPVKLRVYNNAGEWTYSKTVNVQGSTSGKPTPQITPTTFPSNGVKGKSLTFTATSNMATTTGWTWSFGDGTGNDTSQAGQTKQSSTITHTFTKTGTFTVKATGRNSEDAATAPVGVAQGSIVIADAPAIPEYRFLLPVTAHAAGMGGSKWRTDVQIYNPDPQVSETKPLVMEAEFKGHVYPLQMIKSTHIYEDFLGQLLSQQKDDQGPVIITTKSATTPPQIWTRTYNQSENGTFGQFIPAIRLDNAGGAGAVAEGTYYLAGLRHDDRYRTNVGFLNPNAAAITATVTVFDDRHYGIKQFTRTLQPFQLDQITLKNVVENLPTDRPFSVEIEVPSGNWLVAYASFIDGLSQDPVYLQAIRDTDVASADFSTTIIPGVGHTGAWRSDVTIFNPDQQGLEFTLQYFDGGGNKLAEAPGIRVDPRQFIQYGDILKQGVLGNVADGLGTLKIVNTSVIPNDLQPMSFARTYNDDGANGTFGQGIPAFAAARANVKPYKPALLAGVRNSSGEYYTNIGLVNVSTAEVTATVTLLDPISGGAVTSIPYTLSPNQTIVGRFNGWGSITTGTFKIEATGDVWAFASMVDERTKDPEYVAATPIQLQ